MIDVKAWVDKPNDIIADPVGAVAGTTDAKVDAPEIDSSWRDQLDTPESRARRGRYDQATETARRWALTGNGPSAAQALMRNADARAQAQAMSVARSGVGVNPALSQRYALLGMSGAQAQNAAQAAHLRAQEQQAMMQQYSQMYISGRAEELQLAGMDQASALAQAQLEYRANAANAQIEAQNDAALASLYRTVLSAVGGYAAAGSMGGGAGGAQQGYQPGNFQNTGAGYAGPYGGSGYVPYGYGSNYRLPPPQQQPPSGGGYGATPGYTGVATDPDVGSGF